VGAHPGWSALCADFAVPARLGPARPNSLRSLRSLRSNSGREHETKRALARPAPDGRTQPPRNIAPTGQRLTQQEVVLDLHQWRTNTSVCQGVCGQAAARHVRRREAQWPWPRAQRASSTDLSHLFERRERSERSELCDGPRPRASQGSRRTAPTASPKRCGLPAHALAREVLRAKRTVPLSARARGCACGAETRSPDPLHAA
jgi:hypothetical protein